MARRRSARFGAVIAQTVIQDGPGRLSLPPRQIEMPPQRVKVSCLYVGNALECAPNPYRSVAGSFLCPGPTVTEGAREDDQDSLPHADVI